MARDHFKQAMYTPNFVTDNREENRKTANERKSEKSSNLFLRAFKAISRVWVSK